MGKKRKGLAGGIISIIVGSILVIIGISMIITAMSAPDHTYIDSDFSDNLMGGIFCTIFGAMFIVTGIRFILGRNKNHEDRYIVSDSEDYIKKEKVKEDSTSQISNNFRSDFRTSDTVNGDNTKSKNEDLNMNIEERNVQECICPYCGSKVPSSDKYCQHCGAKQE